MGEADVLEVFDGAGGGAVVCESSIGNGDERGGCCGGVEEGEEEEVVRCHDLRLAHGLFVQKERIWQAIEDTP